MVNKHPAPQSDVSAIWWSSCRQLAKTYVDQAMHLYEDEPSRQSLRDLAKVSVANSVSIAQVSLLQLGEVCAVRGECLGS